MEMPADPVNHDMCVNYRQWANACNTYFMNNSHNEEILRNSAISLYFNNIVNQCQMPGIGRSNNISLSDASQQVMKFLPLHEELRALGPDVN
jgi:hypothetical protein